MGTDLCRICLKNGELSDRQEEKADGYQKENKKIMNGGIFEDAKG